MNSQPLKFFLTGFFLSLVFVAAMNYFGNILEDVFYAAIVQPFENMTFIQLPSKEERIKPIIQASSAVSLRINKYGIEKALFRKNTQEILPIASLTKLMTALIVLENQEDYPFPKKISISGKAASQENVPVYGNFENGNIFTIEELLSWMLIYSSNDAAWALSEVMGPDSFVQKMNQKAQEIELENTHFINPTGLEPESLNHNPINPEQLNHSTAQDLLKLTKYILENQPLIFQISLEQGPYTAMNGLSSLSLPGHIMALGGKTGYTDEAGGCILLASVNQKETTFIDIILGASSSQQRIIELQKLINWKR